MSCGGHPISAALLRRIAHAVDGVRTGEQIWLVVQKGPPYRVVRVATQREGADETLAGLDNKDEFMVCGPYQTEADQEKSPYLVILRHGPDSDPENGNGETRSLVTDCVYLRHADFASLPGRPIKGDTVLVLDKIEVRWYATEFQLSPFEKLGDGESKFAGSRTFAWNPEGEEAPMVDSLFFTVAAADSMLFPYLSHVHGHDFAREEKEKVLKALP